MFFCVFLNNNKVLLVCADQTVGSDCGIRRVWCLLFPCLSWQSYLAPGKKSLVKPVLWWWWGGGGEGRGTIFYTGVHQELLDMPVTVHVPSPPVNLRAIALSSTSISVHWGPPQEPKGQITHYSLIYYEVGSTGEEEVTVEQTSYVLQKWVLCRSAAQPFKFCKFPYVLPCWFHCNYLYVWLHTSRTFDAIMFGYVLLCYNIWLCKCKMTADHSFSHFGSSVWNSPPLHIRSGMLQLLILFKSAVKTHLFNLQEFD